ncbi:MAG: calcium-binding protein, partial [Cardiobacteriaceae bacterium]|nr:calcium-binding protein [Cardiobacteriaceae bacterium]
LYRIIVTATDKMGASVSQNIGLSISAPLQSGTEAPDQIWGKADNDRIHGGAGNDKIYGGQGDDEIDGGADNDALWGDTGNDILRGGDGDDYLSGGDGDDILEGGVGNDLLSAGKGNDIYRFSGDFGHDTILNALGNALGKDDGGGHDILEFTDLRLEDIQFEKNGFSTLIIKSRKNNSIVSIQNYFLNDGNSPYHVAEIRLADGRVLDYVAVKAQVYQPTNGDDLVWGDDGDNTLRGGTGNDTLHGGYGNDQLHGDAGNDKLFGYSGNDELTGGQGNDYMIGGAGNDTYHFARDFGRDTINNHDPNANRHDRIIFSELNRADLDIRREGNNLILHDKNGNGHITVQNHFINGWHIDDIRFADGTTLDYDAINQLVQGIGRALPRSVNSASAQQAQQMTQAMATFNSAQPLDALGLPDIRQPLLAANGG